MTQQTPEPWDPTPASSLMDRQAWLNEGGDAAMDEAEIESQREQDVPQPNEPLLKMEPDEPADADAT